MAVYCPNCGKPIACVDFIRQSTERYICVGKCESGEEYFVRFKFTKATDETFSVVRIIYEMDEENANYYYSKKQQKEMKEQAYSEQVAEAI